MEQLEDIVMDWLERFNQKFAQQRLDDEIISPADCLRFLGLHCSLKRDQGKAVLNHWVERGHLLYVPRRGFKFPEATL